MRKEEVFLIQGEQAWKQSWAFSLDLAVKLFLKVS